MVSPQNLQRIFMERYAISVARAVPELGIVIIMFRNYPKLRKAYLLSERIGFTFPTK